jgi:hypothetical protein
VSSLRAGGLWPHACANETGVAVSAQTIGCSVRRQQHRPHSPNWHLFRPVSDRRMISVRPCESLLEHELASLYSRYLFTIEICGLAVAMNTMRTSESDLASRERVHHQRLPRCIPALTESAIVGALCSSPTGGYLFLTIGYFQARHEVWLISFSRNAAPNRSRPTLRNQFFAY